MFSARPRFGVKGLLILIALVAVAFAVWLEIERHQQWRQRVEASRRNFDQVFVLPLPLRQAEARAVLAALQDFGRGDESLPWAAIEISHDTPNTSAFVCFQARWLQDRPSVEKFVIEANQRSLEIVLSAGEQAHQHGVARTDVDYYFFESFTPSSPEGRWLTDAVQHPPVRVQALDNEGRKIGEVECFLFEGARDSGE